ncbi:irregular chiasm C-roughest protein [Drosophila gunungcola]|nr:irregular chiasm C-roughest protein [Drosophila gunungcola]
MRPTFDRRLWILLFIISVQCTTYTQPQNINAKSVQKTKPAERGEAISRSSRSSSSSLSWPSISAVSAGESVDHRGGIGRPEKCGKSCQKAKAKWAKWRSQLKPRHQYQSQSKSQSHRSVLHKEARRRQRRETEEELLDSILSSSSTSTSTAMATTVQATSSSSPSTRSSLINDTRAKRPRSTLHLAPEDMQPKPKEPVIIIDDVEEFDSGSTSTSDLIARKSREEAEAEAEEEEDEGPLEPRVLPLRPVPPNPYEAEEMSVVYAEQHSEIKLMCEVDLDIATSMWYKNGQVVHAMDRTSRVTDYRFIKEANGALTITNVMLEDDGKWQCEAENTRRYTENARPVKLVVLDRPKPPYLLIDSRRLDASNLFVPVKENSELNLACVSEGGNPRPTLTWEVLLSPGVDRHAQKVSAEVLELEEIKGEKLDKDGYKINSGAKSEARLPAVYRAHHNARILCVMEHPTLKIRQNASLLLDVQYTPSFAISRTPGFGYPLREGIEVSLKCDVDSNPPSTPRWQKDDGDTPVPQTGDGFLNFTSIRREHSGWYKCTSRHLNFQYSSIGYYLSVRFDSVDVTSEPDDQDVSVAAASHNPNKGQLEVQLGGAVTLQCPQGSLGCWSHLDPISARLRGLGYGSSQPIGQFSLKDVMYQDAGMYKCVGQSPTNKKKLEVLQSVTVSVKGAPTVMALNATPIAYPGSPLHLNVEFCANPPAHAARWLHGDRVFTPGNQYGTTVLAYAVKDLPTPFCKEARLTYVSMHERVPRTFYFIVSTPGGVAEAVFNVNFTKRHRQLSNSIDDDDEEEELNRPEQIHFPVFSGCPANGRGGWATAAALVFGLAIRIRH